MITGVEILGAAVLSLLGLGGLETLQHRRALGKIPIRVHVAGTRGKSSVTRLLAAGLTGAGIRTAAKTTGTLARMILPDGREVPVFRPAKANIIEQKRIVATAASLNVEALVLECMALNPRLHWVSENKMVRATHGVITNARADHLDVMGPTDRHVAQCLAGMIPVKGTLFTAEAKHLDVFQSAASDRGCDCRAVGAEQIDAVTDEEMAGFSYIEHKENVALALALLGELGVERGVALKGMWNTMPDPGALTESCLDFFGRRILFVNGFAANDPLSTEMIWRRSVKKYSEMYRLVALFNLRGDRPDRTLQLARDTKFWHDAHHIILFGSGGYAFARHAAKAGFDSSRFIFADYPRVDDIFETIVGVCGGSTLVVGMGNIGGPGLQLSNYFKNRALTKESP